MDIGWKFTRSMGEGTLGNGAMLARFHCSETAEEMD